MRWNLELKIPSPNCAFVSIFVFEHFIVGGSRTQNTTKNVHARGKQVVLDRRATAISTTPQLNDTTRTICVGHQGNPHLPTLTHKNAHRHMFFFSSMKVPGPKLANCLENGLTPMLPPAELAGMGFTIAAYPLSLLAVDSLTRTHFTLLLNSLTEVTLSALFVLFLFLFWTPSHTRCFCFCWNSHIPLLTHAQPCKLFEFSCSRFVAVYCLLLPLFGELFFFFRR